MNILAKCLDEKLRPIRAHDGDIGVDLKSSEDAVVRPHSVSMIDTGFALQVPYGYGGFVNGRSGHGKLRIRLANSTGWIDHSYTGNIKLLIENNSDDPFTIHKYDRIGQLAVMPILLADFTYLTELPETQRGDGGFGSTGVK
jgi:dUTP pyrophosphatase